MNLKIIRLLTSFRLPEWTNSVYGPGTDFEQLGLRDFITFTATPEMARLSTGFLIRDILSRCSGKARKTLLPDRSLWLFSAHDSIIVNILNAFGVYTVILNNPFCSTRLSISHVSIFSYTSHRMVRVYISNFTN